MPVETGNQTQVAFIKETVFKTTPATPVGQLLRLTGFTLAGDRNYLDNPELRTDRQKSPGRGGVMIGKGDLSGPLSYGTYDAFLVAGMGSDWVSNVAKIASARTSFTFERLHKVNTIAFPFRGVVVDGWEISGKADNNIDVKFNLIAASCGAAATTTVWSNTTAQGVGTVLTSWDGAVKRNGTALGTVTSWSLKLNNGYQEAKVCGSPDLYDLAMGTCRITGSVELYFDSKQAYDDFVSETDLALQFVIGNGTTSTYQADLPKTRVTKFNPPSTGDGMVSVSFEFESFADATDTALKLTRKP